MTATVSVNVPAREKCYELAIGYGALSYLATFEPLSKATKTFLLYDAGLPQTIIDPVTQQMGSRIDAVLPIPAGESSKGIDGLTAIWSFLSKHKADRRSFVLNLGGGVIGDLGGFAASTYMRGIPFIQIPTTLLSQVDAGIGGKVAINFEGVKNLLGTITPPEAVIVDLNLLSTLSDREFRSGFAEIVKHGLIRDRTFAEKLFSKDAKAWNPTELEMIVLTSCCIKRDVVQIDPFESGERKTLNFGHTVAHALESLSHESDSPLLHGEAVAAGMLIESDIAFRAGILSESEFTAIRHGLRSAGLSLNQPRRYPLTAVMELIARDKKNSGTQVRWSFVTSIGSAVYDRTVENSIVEASLSEHCCG